MRPPFWSTSKAASGLRPGQEHRRTERELRAPGIQPKSVFQLVGGGQVGRGSLYGMQQLHRLADAGFSVWPFDEPRLPLAIEIYPRLVYGPLRRNDRAARSRFLARAGLDDPAGSASATEDAFDATVSAHWIGRFHRAILAMRRDLRYDLEITFEEAARGYETPIQIPRLEACAPCQGSGAAPGTTATTCATSRTAHRSTPRASSTCPTSPSALA